MPSLLTINTQSLKTACKVAWQIAGIVAKIVQWNASARGEGGAVGPAANDLKPGVKYKIKQPASR